ncbi:hypothetical protein K438DRAFT_1784454 [Mycena galopus ATCC 62051]|nr:hypothetical protein K438DRAFT_1784454 [Mycena galopus ATCC 62051]
MSEKSHHHPIRIPPRIPPIIPWDMGFPFPKCSRPGKSATSGAVNLGPNINSNLTTLEMITVPPAANISPPARALTTQTAIRAYPITSKVLTAQWTNPDGTFPPTYIYWSPTGTVKPACPILDNLTQFIGHGPRPLPVEAEIGTKVTRRAIWASVKIFWGTTIPPPRCPSVEMYLGASGCVKRGDGCADKRGLDGDGKQAGRQQRNEPK